MKKYILLLLLFSSVCVVSFGATEVTRSSEIDTVDLHHQTINFSNCDEKMRPIEELDLRKTYKIDLRDNYIDDEVVESLVKLLESSKLIYHLQALDLSNNRISREGLLMLMSLVQEETFQWLVIPINCLDVSDVGAFMHALKEKARSIAPERGIASDILALEWVRKIIWLPESYDLDSLPLEEEVKASHRAYYATK
jgi:Leucine Rich repeat